MAGTHIVRHRWALPVLFVAILFGGGIDRGVATAGTQTGDAVTYQDRAAESGFGFLHENGRTDEKYLPETMGGGVLLFDYDDDGWLDVFFVNSGSIATPPQPGAVAHALYRNNGDGTFSDVVEGSGIKATGYGMGACAADIDNDGRVDVYVTSFGSNALFRNLGAGRFEEVTSTAHVESPLWSSSCAFGDIDNDGWVDLYVVNYLEFTPETNPYCGDPVAEVRIYCDPNVYGGVPDNLYRNNGDGTFTDVTREAGVYSREGKGLGVVFGDFDVDGWADIYVANDLVGNFLYHNTGDGVFEEIGLVAGVAVGGDGRPMSGMGTDMGDIDGDGLAEVFVTNMDRETHNLYANLGDGLFVEVTFESGVGTATLPYVGWGTAFIDYDNDTDLDLAIANGAVLDNVDYFRDSTYAQRNLLLENDGGGSFSDVTSTAGSGFALLRVSRGLAAGDLDNDGDVDLVIGNNGQTPNLLRNEGGNARGSLLVRLRGVDSNRDGIGARVRLWVDDQVIVREVRAGSSYLGQNDIRAHFGLDGARRADRLEIAWPSGAVDTVEDIGANQVVVIQEGRGIVSQAPFN